MVAFISGMYLGLCLYCDRFDKRNENSKLLPGDFERNSLRYSLGYNLHNYDVRSLKLNRFTLQTTTRSEINCKNEDCFLDKRGTYSYQCNKLATWGVGGWVGGKPHSQLSETERRLRWLWLCVPGSAHLADDHRHIYIANKRHPSTNRKREWTRCDISCCVHRQVATLVLLLSVPYDFV